MTALRAAAGVAIVLSAMGLAGCTEDTASNDQDQEEEVDSAQQAVTATTVTIEASGPGGPVRDTFIYAQFPTYNYGSKTTIEVGKPSRYNGYNWGPDDRKQGLIRFDLSSIPAGSYIASATLSLRVSDVLPSHGAFFGEIYAYFVTGNAWVDTSLTWNSYGQKFQPGFWKQLSSVSQGSWATVDAKDFVSSWVSGSKPNFGLLLESSTVMDNVASFVSSEGPPGQRPKLAVTYYPSTCAPNPCQNGGTCNQNGPDTYACACKPGYGGTHCEVDTNACSPNPCANGATCVNDPAKPEGYTCNCLSNNFGPKCEYLDLCAQVGPYVCVNGGTCNNIAPPPASGPPYSCSCPPGYSGKHCQIPPPPPYCPCGDPAVDPYWKRILQLPGVEAVPTNFQVYGNKCIAPTDMSQSRTWVARFALPAAGPIQSTLAYVNRYYQNASNYCAFQTNQFMAFSSQLGVISSIYDPAGFQFCVDYPAGVVLPITESDHTGCRQQMTAAPHVVAQTLPDLPLPIALAAPGLLALAEVLRRRFGKKVAS